MYDYLKDFNTFYKFYSEIHAKITYLNHSTDNNCIDGLDLKSAQNTHSSFLTCILNILQYYSGNVEYISLIDENKHFFSHLSLVVERHYRTGTKLGYLLSGFNMVFECFCKMVLESELPDKEKAVTIENLRKIHSAYIVVLTSKWVDKDCSHYKCMLEDKISQIVRLDERFTQHIDMRRAAIAFIDSEGAILKVNKAAKMLFGLNHFDQKYHIMDVLDYHFMSFEAFIQHYSHAKRRPVRLMNGEKFFMSMTPLIYKDGVVCEYVIIMKSADSDAAPERHKTNDNIEHSLRLKKLTYTETQICNFIYNGATSKKIAELMNISIETVKTHRKNIRKKLDLCETGVNMYAYMKNKG